MKLYQAFKAKKKLIAEIDELKSIIRDNNSRIVGTKVKYDVNNTMETLAAKSMELVVLKTNIMRATMPIYRKLHQLSELKSMAAFLKGVPNAEGPIRTRSYDANAVPIIYECVYDELKLKAQVKSYEHEIEKTQEEIDAFNHTTDLVTL